MPVPFLILGANEGAVPDHACVIEERLREEVKNIYTAMPGWFWEIDFEYVKAGLKLSRGFL